ncbi:hypothetical protein [Paenibacillus endoradicis]|uniref:hypothetical protein n=1 Tax=Paenibacillus endoradicis TaxID=2972487 RepID=UPI002158A32D|nr:hypothetical protein [Paenibacillus endoradicis]MCR8657460.1 hypothetical protein [Paenibacillus endoradicis]
MPSKSMMSTSKDTEKVDTNKTLPPIAQTKSSNLTDLQKTVGNQELARIAEEEQFGLTETEFYTIYETNLYKPLKSEVLYKFGVGRSAFRRSKKLNDFRQTMKDAARAQASEDIATHLDSNSSLAGNSNISKQFNSMLANKEAHSQSKVSVNSIMEKESDRILHKLVPEDTAVQQLKQAALASVSSSTLKEKDKKKKAASSAKDKAKDLLERFKEPAINEARIIIKGDQSAGAAEPNQVKVDDMTKEVKGQVTLDQIGEKALKKVIETDSVNSGLSKIAPIINSAVPYDGDSASLDFELKIPVSSGVFVSIGLGAEAEKDDGHMTIGANIAVGAGVSAGITDVAVKLGMFIEAKGSSVQSSLNLVSYGMYRNMNAGLPSLAQRLWGKGGLSGKSRLEEAELWAATVEAREMEDTENYVDVGQSLSASAEIETGIYSGEFELSGQRYTKYSKESFETIPDLLFGENTETTLDALTQKSTRMNQLKTYKKLSASSSTELTLPGVTLAFSAEGAITFFDRALEQLEASISVDLPGEIAGFSAWETIVEEAIPKVISATAKIQKLIQAKNTTSTGQTNNVQDARMKALQEQLENKASELTTMLSEATETVDPETGEVESVVEKDSGLTLNFGLELGFKDGKSGDWKIEFDITKSSSIKIETPFLSLELEKSRKLMSASRGKKDGQIEKELNFYQS